jgi:tetratricopeptide (TPR) repeat protein
MQDDWIWMNHYCPALMKLARLENFEFKVLNKRDRRKSLDFVIDGIDYQLRHGTWTKRNAWFRAEALTNKARALQMRGHHDRAQGALVAATKVYPPYLPAYWELADIYEKRKQREKAVGALSSALKHAHKKSHAERIEQRLDRLKKQVAAQPGDQVDEPGTRGPETAEAKS